MFILVTEYIIVTADTNTDVALKNYAPFSTCKAEINDIFINEAHDIYMAAMPMYNLIEYSVNYPDTSGSSLQLKRDEVPANNTDLNIDNLNHSNIKQLS